MTLAAAYFLLADYGTAAVLFCLMAALIITLYKALIAPKSRLREWSWSQDPIEVMGTPESVSDEMVARMEAFAEKAEKL